MEIYEFLQWSTDRRWSSMTISVHGGCCGRQYVTHQVLHQVVERPPQVWHPAAFVLFFFLIE